MQITVNLVKAALVRTQIYITFKTSPFVLKYFIHFVAKNLCFGKAKQDFGDLFT